MYNDALYDEAVGPNRTVAMVSDWDTIEAVLDGFFVTHADVHEATIESLVFA